MRVPKKMMMMLGGFVPWYLAGSIPAASCIAAYKAVGAASLAASYINLINPGTYDLTAPVAAPTFAAATGWTFNGTTQYLLMAGYAIQNDSRNRSAILRFSGIAGSTGYAFGYFINSQGFMTTPNRTAVSRYFNGGTGLSGGAVYASGVQAIAGDQAYYNGAVEGSITTSGNVDGAGITIGASMANSVGPTIHTYLAGNIQAFALYNAILTPAQVIAVTNAMAALPPP